MLETGREYQTTTPTHTIVQHLPIELYNTYPLSCTGTAVDVRRRHGGSAFLSP